MEINIFGERKKAEEEEEEENVQSALRLPASIISSGLGLDRREVLTNEVLEIVLQREKRRIEQRKNTSVRTQTSGLQTH